MIRGIFGAAYPAARKHARQQQMYAERAKHAAIKSLSYRLYREAVHKSPISEAIKCGEIWLPIIPGKTSIPRVGRK